MGASRRAKILIVDDHPAIREALAFRIGLQPDLEVCGEAADLREALQMVADTRPEVAVIDISLKSDSGIDLIKRIKDRNDCVRMIVWSTHSETLYAERALRSGALGYINKDQATDKIIDAIRAVRDGKLYLSEAMQDDLLYRNLAGRREDATQGPVEVLSDRELEVFQMIGNWKKTSEIAKELHLSIKTVEYYREQIKHKLNLGSGSELTQYATSWVQRENPA